MNYQNNMSVFSWLQVVRLIREARQREHTLMLIKKMTLLLPDGTRQPLTLIEGKYTDNGRILVVGIAK